MLGPEKIAENTTANGKEPLPGTNLVKVAEIDRRPAIRVAESDVQPFRLAAPGVGRKPVMTA